MAEKFLDIIIGGKFNGAGFIEAEKRIGQLKQKFGKNSVIGEIADILTGKGAVGGLQDAVRIIESIGREFEDLTRQIALGAGALETFGAAFRKIPLIGTIAGAMWDIGQGVNNARASIGNALAGRSPDSIEGLRYTGRVAGDQAAIEAMNRLVTEQDKQTAEVAKKNAASKALSLWTTNARNARESSALPAFMQGIHATRLKLEADKKEIDRLEQSGAAEEKVRAAREELAAATRQYVRKTFFSSVESAKQFANSTIGGAIGIGGGLLDRGTSIVGRAMSVLVEGYKGIREDERIRDASVASFRNAEYAQAIRRRDQLFDLGRSSSAIYNASRGRIGQRASLIDEIEQQMRDTEDPAMRTLVGRLGKARLRLFDAESRPSGSILQSGFGSIGEVTDRFRGIGSQYGVSQQQQANQIAAQNLRETQQARALLKQISERINQLVEGQRKAEALIGADGGAEAQIRAADLR